MPAKRGINPVTIRPLRPLHSSGLACTIARLHVNNDKLLSVALVDEAAEQPLGLAVLDEDTFINALGHLFPRGELRCVHQDAYPNAQQQDSALDLLEQLLALTEDKLVSSDKEWKQISAACADLREEQGADMPLPPVAADQELREAAQLLLGGFGGHLTSNLAIAARKLAEHYLTRSIVVSESELEDLQSLREARQFVPAENARGTAGESHILAGRVLDYLGFDELTKKLDEECVVLERKAERFDKFKAALQPLLQMLGVALVTERSGDIVI